MNAYTDLKPAWHLSKIAALRRGIAPVPAQIQLVISDLCNHDCPWCAYRMTGYPSNQHFWEVKSDGTRTNNPARFIPAEKAIEILRDAHTIGVYAVQFTGGGEPTVHPRHLDVFRAALDLGYECALVTNGCLLRDGWQDVLGRFQWVRVSLDAGSRETYAAVRRVDPSMFDKAVMNIARLADTTIAHLGVSFVVLRENYKEAAHAAYLARENGADSIRFAAMFSNEDERYYQGWYDEARAEIDKAANMAGDHFAVIDMLGQRVGDLRQHAPDYAFCGYQYFNVYVGGDLGVYRCCDTAYNDRGFVGSLKAQTFAEWWTSEAKANAYKDFDARGCSRCAFNGKNRVIRDLVEEGAIMHPNFV